jgi:hypothetical protein
LLCSDHSSLAFLPVLPNVTPSVPRKYNLLQTRQ